jgi:hypothetical protein
MTSFHYNDFFIWQNLENYEPSSHIIYFKSFSTGESKILLNDKNTDYKYPK